MKIVITAFIDKQTKEVYKLSPALPKTYAAGDKVVSLPDAMAASTLEIKSVRIYADKRLSN